MRFVPILAALAVAASAQEELVLPEEITELNGGSTEGSTTGGSTTGGSTSGESSGSGNSSSGSGKLDLENQTKETLSKGLEKTKKAIAYIRGSFDYLEGAIEVALGIFICFFGKPMIGWVVRAILFFGITAGLFMGFQSLNDEAGLYAGFQKKETQAQLIIGGVCIVLAAGTTYFISQKVKLEEKATQLIIFMGAAFGTMLALVSISMPGWVKYVAMAAAGVAAACCLTKTLGEVTILCYGTGFIGSVLINHGVSMYAGGFPSMSNVEELKNQKVSAIFVAYVVGIAIFTFVGGKVQSRKAEESDNDFMNPDNQ